nr:hypothetical protein TDPV-164 [Oriental turtle dovepox virus]
MALIIPHITYLYSKLVMYILSTFGYFHVLLYFILYLNSIITYYVKIFIKHSIIMSSFFLINSKYV